MHKKLFFILVISFFYYDAESQSIQRISASVFNESIAFPFTRFTPFHLGGEASITIVENKESNTIKNWNIALGGYHHERVENGIYLRAEYLYRPIVKSNFTFDMIGGLGYLHTFYPGDVYEINKNTGDFEKINQSGRAHALATLGIGFTYIKNENLQPFIRQEIGIESPFLNGVPVIIHSFLKIGLSYKVKRQ